MVSQTRALEIGREIARAEAAGLETVEAVEIDPSISSDAPLGAERVRLRDGSVAQQGFSYQVPDAEKAAWVPAWRLHVGLDGVVYGAPVPILNRTQLGYHLSKRRPDGGPLFTIEIPERVTPEGRFQCFVAPEQCTKKVDSKGKLLRHMRAYHPAECEDYEDEIEILRKSSNRENSVVRGMIERMAALPDDPSMPVPENVRREQHAAVADIDVGAGAEVPTEMTKPEFLCQYEGCSWKPKDGTMRPDTALRMHIFAKHKEVE